MSQLSEEQEDMLRHMLGINDRSIAHPKPQRNYAAVEPDDSSIVGLEQLGMVERYGRIDRYALYRCTDRGRAAAFASHKRRRYSKAKRRYIRFLHCRDAYSDLTFRKFLTDPYFDLARREA